VDGSSRSNETHQESVLKVLLYTAAELKICIDGQIITSHTPNERYANAKRITY